jgi:aminoglycoside phosphotransferase (APT) family kinase protein
MTAIPASIDEVTAAWLAEVTGREVEAVGIEQIGEGIGVSSALYRCWLDCGGMPESVIVKLPALDEAAVFTSTVLSMYKREVAFFRELAALSPIRVPACHHAAVDDESRFLLVMEDLGEHRVVDQVLGMGLDDARAAVDGLARWHATWWGKAEALAEAGVTLSLADPIYPAIVPMVFDEGWDKVIAAGIDVPDPIRAVREGFNAALPGLLADLAQAPTTVIHGDYRADNLVFCPDGSVAAFDFQLIGTGSGSYDLAYFVTQSLEPSLASAEERGLFERYTAGLLAGGVPEGDLGRLWEDYRKAALFCLVYPIVASRGMDLDDPRQRALVECMMGRFSRAVDELQLVELL